MTLRSRFVAWGAYRGCPVSGYAVRGRTSGTRAEIGSQFLQSLHAFVSVLWRPGTCGERVQVPLNPVFTRDALATVSAMAVPFRPMNDRSFCRQCHRGARDRRDGGAPKSVWET